MALNTRQLRAMRRNGAFSTVRHDRRLWLKCARMAFIAIIILLIGIISAHAATVPLNDKNAILAIIGEGENQGYTGMLALAGAIRNRGTLKGVYGINAPRVVKHKYSSTTYNQAKKAWAESEYKDTTKGAEGWGNDRDLELFKQTAWFGKCRITTQVKDHWFYTCNERG